MAQLGAAVSSTVNSVLRPPWARGARFEQPGQCNVPSPNACEAERSFKALLAACEQLQVPLGLLGGGSYGLLLQAAVPWPGQRHGHMQQHCTWHRALGMAVVLRHGAMGVANTPGNSHNRQGAQRLHSGSLTVEFWGVQGGEHVRPAARRLVVAQHNTITVVAGCKTARWG